MTPVISKLRGVDKWPEVSATVVSTEVVSEGGYEQPPPSVRLSFYYRDLAGDLQSGEIVADSLTSLYNVQVNDTFTLRYNPKVPSKFYCAEVSSFFTEFRLTFWILVGFFALILSVIMLVKK